MFDGLFDGAVEEIASWFSWFDDLPDAVWESASETSLHAASSTQDQINQ